MAAIPHPPPLDPSYHPTASVKHLPKTASLEDVISVLEQDGGLIIDNFVSPQDVSQVASDVAKHHNIVDEKLETTAISIIPKETVLTPGLVGLSPTVAEICEHPLLDGLRKKILTDTWTVTREGYEDHRSTDALLSLTIGFNIGPGAPRQRIHRDDWIHPTKHDGNFDIRKETQFACLIAGTETTQENGATMFVPGSHRLDDSTYPTLDQITFAGACLPTILPTAF
jgi:swainsonine biosynthesis dioxygenase SwnH1/2